MSEPIDILYADDHLAVVNKPSGMLVHRGWGRDAVVAMTAARDQLGRYVYPVHRLDRGASGALVFALSKQAARGLCDQFAAGTIAKRYVALVRGVPDPAGVIDHPIPNKPGGERVAAITSFRRLESFGRYSLIEATPRTGRLHQIRRHMKHISCPLIGDVNYGKGEHNRLFRERYGLHRLALHATHVGFDHPLTGATLAIEAPLAPELERVLAALRAS